MKYEKGLFMIFCGAGLHDRKYGKHFLITDAVKNDFDRGISNG